MKGLKIGNLAIAVPVIQGGMGVGISLSGLAAAVANEGGVGVISSAGLGLLYRDFSENFLEASILGLKEEIRKAREKTRGIIGVNVMVAMTNFVDMIKTSISEKVDIIIAGAGLPLDLPSFLKKDSITKLIPIVSSARAARIICEKWKTNYDYLPDAVIVEGPKAGGHLGFKEEQIEDKDYTLEKLVPEIAGELKMFEEKYNKTIPLIAAGGIYTGEDIKNILELGASGVQMGTRFVTTHECDASPGFKQAYINASEKDIEIIRSPVGMPGRAIFSEFIRKVKEGKKQPLKCPFKCIRTCDISKSPYCIIIALINALKGNFKNGFAFAGSNAFRATKITSVKEIFQSLIKEYQESK
ncbi:MAG TPA: nitronate monooxygenase family protein [Bacteroidales bacterium]|nr:nitronate monooxygenase family protein [Bacteroidales bacterium]HOX73981.1 nitronate monooxygenase family protein [Bacteroidales bacterium]HPM87710.1 nitronate monooxygenase family protein [Bacteroidales bacterium]HQM69971.1 nitronate monooxygenase family protein [Bacteroidales bacterium]